jgi:DNA-binding response OmpR family regulator
MGRVLLISTDAEAEFVVKVVCRNAGHELAVERRPLVGLARAVAHDPDVVVVHARDPQGSGEALLHVLADTTRVIALSSAGTHEPDALRRLGVHNALTLPLVPSAFDAALADELARPRSPHRFGRRHHFSVAPLQLDLSARAVRHVHEGTWMNLPGREFALLHYLMANAGRLCSRQELLEVVWDLPFDPQTNVVDVTVRRLRARVGADLIETVRCQGYVYAPCLSTTGSLRPFVRPVSA